MNLWIYESMNLWIYESVFMVIWILIHSELSLNLLSSRPLSSRLAKLDSKTSPLVSVSRVHQLNHHQKQSLQNRTSAASSPLSRSLSSSTVAPPNLSAFAAAFRRTFPSIRRFAPTREGRSIGSDAGKRIGGCPTRRAIFEEVLRVLSCWLACREIQRCLRRSWLTFFLSVSFEKARALFIRKKVWYATRAVWILKMPGALNLG